LRSAAAPPEPFRWQGIALGAVADLTLYAADRSEAARAIEACLAEIARLEAIFSLHRPESALSRLNRLGQLAEPPFELVELLAQALLFIALTVGLVLIDSNDGVAYLGIHIGLVAAAFLLAQHNRFVVLKRW